MLFSLWFTEFAHEYKHQQERCGCQQSIKLFKQTTHTYGYVLKGFWISIMQNVFHKVDAGIGNVLCKLS